VKHKEKMAKTTEDRFTNILSANVTLSAADTSTYSEVVTGVSLGSGIGLLIDHIDYMPDVTSIALMTAATDSITMMWATSSNAAYSLGNSYVIDMNVMYRYDMGTAASGELVYLPISRYFTPPMIIATPRLFLYMSSNGLASAASGSCRIFFRYINLTDKEYLEIAETFSSIG